MKDVILNKRRIKKNLSTRDLGLGIPANRDENYGVSFERRSYTLAVLILIILSIRFRMTNLTELALQEFNPLKFYLSRKSDGNKSLPLR